MTLTEDSPDGRSQDLTCAESEEKILIDLKTFNQIFELISVSIDEISQARRREIFLYSLEHHLTRSENFDDFPRIEAALLLDAYYDFVPASLAKLDRNFQEAWQLMEEAKTNLIGGIN
ncbi:MAG TPA: hypothetical protein VF691_20285 [Cytophagaceae bacterium]|jgi:hypothetical protein